VVPDFQGKGLEGVHEIHAETQAEDISNITLFADPHIVIFIGSGF